MSRMGFFAGQTSTPIPTDPFWTSVVLLCHFDGTNGSTTITDNSNSAHTMGVAGNTQLTTAVKQFGTAAVIFDGANDYCSTSTTVTDFQFGAASWTVEGWFRRNAAVGAAQSLLVGQWRGNFNQRSWAIFLSATDGFLQVSRSTDGTNIFADIVSSTTLSDTVFENVAADYDSGTGTLRLYKGGAMIGKLVQARTLFASPTDLTMGCDLALAFDYNGYADDARITKGVARYASDAGFAVPTAAFPNS